MSLLDPIKESHPKGKRLFLPLGLIHVFTKIHVYLLNKAQRVIGSLCWIGEFVLILTLPIMRREHLLLPYLLLQ